MPVPLPPHAVIPNLEVDGNAVTDWRQLGSVTQKQRELVIKPSGFSEFAWGSRGVAIGHDLPTEEWEAVIENSLENFEKNPYVLQKFHTAERVRMQYYDFDAGDVPRDGVSSTPPSLLFCRRRHRQTRGHAKRRSVQRTKRFYTAWWILLSCRAQRGNKMHMSCHHA